MEVRMRHAESIQLQRERLQCAKRLEVCFEAPQPDSSDEGGFLRGRLQAYPAPELGTKKEKSSIKT